jgi:alkanesulfonate monooxygenase SsuD/methylene tetrahydromethanopterin reductase-like flavin-dependent oxidoreductase (luciferase family)
MAEQRPVKIGLGIDLSEYPEDYFTGTARRTRSPDRWSDILAMSKAAEYVGYDSVWLSDHLIFNLVEGSIEGAWECMSILAALAASTSRVELGTWVICTGFRNPALLAKMADTIDEISGSRLILGLGAGWHDYEFEAFGFPSDHKYSRFNEAIQIIHGLLHLGRFDFDGHFYQVRDCELCPRGPRAEGPPILIGTMGPKMLRLTARYANVWNGIENTNELPRFEAYVRMRGAVDAACEEVGRDPATLERSLCVGVNPLNRPEFSRSFRGETISGTPEEIAGTLLRFADEGISHLLLDLHPVSVEGVEAVAPVLEILDNA